jgi:hypothetical protein
MFFFKEKKNEYHDEKREKRKVEGWKNTRIFHVRLDVVLPFNAHFDVMLTRL